MSFVNPMSDMVINKDDEGKILAGDYRASDLINAIDGRIMEIINPQTGGQFHSEAEQSLVSSIYSNYGVPIGLSYIQNKQNGGSYIDTDIKHKTNEAIISTSLYDKLLALAGPENETTPSKKANKIKIEGSRKTKKINKSTSIGSKKSRRR